MISHDKIPGIPRDPDTLADILIERGFAVPNTVQEKGERAYYRYWEVLPEMLRGGGGIGEILMLRLESNDPVFTTEPPAAVAAEVVGDVEDAEIEFVDPEEVDDDQEEDVSALNDDMLAAEQEAEKALAGLGFGDAMEMLKSTSDAVEEKPEQKMLDQRNHLSLTLARRVSRRANRAKQNRRVIQRNNPTNQRQRGFVPQDIAKNAPPLANDNPLQALKDVGGGLGTSTFRLTHSAHRQRQPALTQQTQKSQMWQCPESKRSSQNRTSFHKNKTPAGR